MAIGAELPWLCPQFIRLAQTLKYYGYLKFDPCITDFPEKGCHVVVSAGNNELNFQVRLPSEQIKEGSFKVTRMRCWRVTSSVSATCRRGLGSRESSVGSGGTRPPRCSGSSPRERCWLCCLLPAQLGWGVLWG